MKNLCPDLAAIFCAVVNVRHELETYGEKLEASITQEEQTNSFEIADGAVKLLESAVKSLYFDEYERYLKNKE
ncbi:MAG: hypothetical protein LBQ22_05725 [Bacteroidales bacterium]|jgi:hypothetical protein|nr:hypothetical protein [Bacteroidales bacterium]